MNVHFRLWIGCCALTLAYAASGVSALAVPGSAKTTAQDALRLLQAECFACHSETKKKGGLVLTTRESLLRGGNDGIVVTPGQPEASKLLQLLPPDADPHMPPKKQLEPAQIKLLREWISDGLVWDERVLETTSRVVPVTLATLPPGYRPVLALALSPASNRLAVARGGRLWVYDLTSTNYAVVAEAEAHQDAIQSLAWSADGQTLASGGFRRVVLWDGEHLSRKAELTHEIVGTVTALAFTAHSNRLALADSVSALSGVIALMDIGAGRRVVSWRAHADTIYDLEFSRDGRRLVTAGADKLIRIWDTESYAEIAVLEGHAAPVTGVAFNTNATQVVSGGTDRELKVWNIETREKVISLGRSSAAVSAVAWPGDGQAIFAATEAGTAFSYRNLKSHTGEQSSASGDERKLSDVGDPLLSLASSVDGKTIFAGTQKGDVYVWNHEGKSLAKLAAPETVTPLTVETVEPQPQGNRPTKPSLTARYRPSPALAKLAASTVTALVAEPREIRLGPGAPRHGVLIAAETPEGWSFDVTDDARLSTGRDAPFAVPTPGEIVAIRPGRGVLTAHFMGRRVEVPVEVRSGASEHSPSAPVSFVRDILPVLSKAGCNAGACHAKPEGQNGFKLSVFSYDPKADYAEIVTEARGRRVFPATPEESLFLKKPTAAVPHEGGMRFERGSEIHQLLTRWVRTGMPYELTNEPTLSSIEIFPKERRYAKGATQRLLVQALYSDGSARDVTPLATFAENDKEIVKVNDRGVVTVGTLTGQGVVVARYMGRVADSQVLVPADRLLPAGDYAALPRYNFIDDLAYAQFQRLGLYPSDLCTDEEFLRRASLDSIGVLPTPAEVREFSGAEKPHVGRTGGNGDGETPSRVARQALISRLLERPEFADYWANKWADLLRPNPDRVGVKSVLTLDHWLRESFRANKPYDQFVREILTAEGSNHREGPAVIYRDRREPPELTTMFGQLFLGTRFECAKCHHHPNEKWSQDDFYQLAAFFGPVKQKGAGLSPPISAGMETFYFTSGGAVKHPVTGATMSPRPPDTALRPVAEGSDPRSALVDWLLEPDNPYFARAAVNRVWANFFGRGLVEPVDDLRISNPCVNSPLLDALARDFVQHRYDLKHLIRTILSSRLYQLSSTPNESNLGDTKYFSRAYRRRLPAEVLLDAVNEVVGVPDTYAAMPIGSRAMQGWSYKIESQFMDAFSRPNPSSDPPCERDAQMSVVQALHLMNAKSLQAKLSHPEGRVHQLATGEQPPPAVVMELYLTALGRGPTDEELARATAVYAADGATRQSATEDILWALLNSPEFVFNH